MANLLHHYSRGEFTYRATLGARLTLGCRYTFSWIDTLLSRARRGPQIGFEDMPSVDYHTRSANLEAAFRAHQFPNGCPLWLRLYHTHHHLFWWQWFLSVLQSGMAYIPQLCLFKILEILEHKSYTSQASTVLCLWAVGMGLSRLAFVFVDTR